MNQLDLDVSSLGSCGVHDPADKEGHLGGNSVVSWRDISTLEPTEPTSNLKLQNWAIHYVNRYVKKVEGKFAWSRVVSYNTGSRNLPFDFFDISVDMRSRH